MTLRLLLTGVALTAMLAACDRASEAPAPSATAPATLPLTVDEPLAPTGDALPPAAPAPLAEAPAANYDEDAYWEEASRADDYYADRAPDYAFDYGAQEPAAWVDGGAILRLVERLAGGGERTYYYRRGEDRPYYVRDPDYAYGYDRGNLVTVYDARTRRALTRDDARQRAALAGRYLARSQELRQAAARTETRDRRQLDQTQYRQWRQREDIQQRQERAREQAQEQQRARETAERERAAQERERTERDRDRGDRERGERDRGDRDRNDRDRDRPQRPAATPPVVAKPAPTPAPKPAERPERPNRPDREQRPDRDRPTAAVAKPAPVVVAKPAPAPAAKPAPAEKAMTPAERRAAREALATRERGQQQQQER